MDVTADDLAGVVDLFGALTRPELGSALAELAFKRGEAYDPERFEPDIDDALQSYHLVAVPAAETGVDADDSLLVAGPVAFPALPAGAADLPHILDIDQRAVTRATAVQAARDAFRRDASVAVEAGDAERVETLLDVSYELEAWGSVDMSAVRDRLDATDPSTE